MTFRYNNVFVNGTGTSVGPYENDGPLSGKFDKSYEDLYCGEDSWEKAEVKLQQDAIEAIFKKTKRDKSVIDVLISGDLLNQISASTYAAEKFDIPHLGVFSACATSMEGIIIASSLIDSGKVKSSIVSTSSHNMASEKQFRNPTEYGAPKPKTSTFTSTGGAAILLSSTKSKVKVESSTIGTIVDMGQNDPLNMGAAMACAAGDVINKHLRDMKRDINYYDLIVTGDLGIYGKEILSDYMKTEFGIDLGNNYNDTGTMLYNVERQEEVLAGGSGPATCPLVAYTDIIPALEKGILKRVLVVATGALFSPTFIFQKENICSVAHAVSLESVNR